MLRHAGRIWGARTASDHWSLLRKGVVLLHSTPDGRALMLADNGSDCHIGRFQARLESMNRDGRFLALTLCWHDGAAGSCCWFCSRSFYTVGTCSHPVSWLAIPGSQSSSRSAGASSLCCAQELSPTCADLNRIPSLHHIVAVNDASGSATLGRLKVEEACELDSAPGHWLYPCFVCDDHCPE